MEAIAVESTGVSVEAVEVDEEQDGKLRAAEGAQKGWCQIGRGSFLQERAAGAGLCRLMCFVGGTGVGGCRTVLSGPVDDAT